MNKRLSRRSFFAGSTAAAVALHTAMARLPAARAEGPAKRPTAKDTFSMARQGKKIPVILDTDIGGDIDDTWALVTMLKSPEFDVKLVCSDSGNDTYRARILAKMLQVAHATEIPVGIGCGPGDKPGRQSRWVGEYQLKQYPGTVHEDGVGAIIDTIRAAVDPITLVAIGPVPNVAEALRRAPEIAQKARFVGMHGSIRRGYGGNPKVSAEYNVRANPKALQAVFAAPWDITITPLDTCGLVQLTGEKFQKVYRCEDPIVQALMQNYQVWREAGDSEKKDLGPPDRSSTLYDPVAVYLALSEELLGMETLPVRVTDDGYTVVDEKARPVHCATRWKDLGAFEDELVRRLTSAG